MERDEITIAFTPQETVRIWTHGPVPDDWAAKYPDERIESYRLIKAPSTLCGHEELIDALERYPKPNETGVGIEKLCRMAAWSLRFVAKECDEQEAAKERLASMLETINRRASPAPHRTLGACADELMMIADLARAALPELKDHPNDR